MYMHMHAHVHVQAHNPKGNSPAGSGLDSSMTFIPQACVRGVLFYHSAQWYNRNHDRAKGEIRQQSQFNEYCIFKLYWSCDPLTALKVDTLIASHLVHARNGWGRRGRWSRGIALVHILSWHFTFIHRQI